MPLLEIKNLHAQVAGGGRQILKGVDLTIDTGETHAIMGKNGSGKSTLCQVLAGREVYEVTEGQIFFNGKDLLEMSPEERAREGLFLGFQYPVEIPGVSTSYFLKAAVNEIRKHHGQPELNAVEFLKLVQSKMDLLGMDKSFMNRAINEGFSGGEKKRNEVFQMAVVSPLLALLDETDSGLDVDALRTVANGVNAVHQSDPNKAILLVTHYLRMLEYIVPDHVHVMMDGRIVRSGGRELAVELDKHGYKLVGDEVGADA
jgi:Fe-S cluster assembly ATP-binding protein